MLLIATLGVYRDRRAVNRSVVPCLPGDSRGLSADAQVSSALRSASLAGGRLSG
jgi:hypothetical protein